MPRWLVPWVVPLTIVFVVLAVALGGVGAIVLYVCVAGPAAYARLRYLKRDPSNPELVRKPFWRF
jgi:hypothetical protein